MSIADRAVSSRATSSTSLAGIAFGMPGTVALRAAEGERDEFGEAVFELGGDGGRHTAAGAGGRPPGREGARPPRGARGARWRLGSGVPRPASGPRRPPRRLAWASPRSRGGRWSPARPPFLLLQELALVAQALHEIAVRA